MDISKLSITELKAMNFDNISEIERLTSNVRKINNRIIELQKQNQPEDAEVVK